MAVTGFLRRTDPENLMNCVDLRSTKNFLSVTSSAAFSFSFRETHSVTFNKLEFEMGHADLKMGNEIFETC